MIDGYNLFFRLEEFPNPLQNKRESFIEALSIALQEALLFATVVFDSNTKEAPIYPSSSHAYPHLEIVFSPKGLCADRYILEYLQALSNASHLVLVTDDKRLILFAKEEGVKHLSLADFLAKLSKKRAPLKQERKTHSQSKAEFERLLKIFEEKFKQNDRS